MSFCPKCGKQPGFGGKFCQNCGQTLEHPQSQGPLEHPQSQGSYVPKPYQPFPPAYQPPSQIPTPSNAHLDSNYLQNNSQDGLVTGAYICAALSLLFLPIIFGPMGVVLGVIASSNGDERGTTAAIVSGVCMFLGFIISMFLFASFFY